MARQPAFSVARTLLGGEPDCNRRTIYADDTMSVVKEFNVEMAPWTAEMEAELRRELASLNDMASKRGI